jgi:outer membrane protein OmpA-like peptidoglycan-associated protein
MSVRGQRPALVACALLLSGCSATTVSRTDAVPLFSHSNPVRNAEPGGSVAATIQPAVIHFANDSHEVTPEQRRKLLDFFERFPDNSWQPIVLEGHTDANESEEYNMRLAERRIRSVRAELRTLGYPGELLSEWPLGESRPVATNATAAGRQLNRRVVVRLP